MTEAGALRPKQMRQKRALLMVLVGTGALVLIAAVVAYLDTPSTQLQSVNGEVTSVMRGRSDYIYCQVRLDNGVVINEPCANFPVGTKVIVDRLQTRMTHRIMYAVHL